MTPAFTFGVMMEGGVMRLLGWDEYHHWLVNALPYRWVIVVEPKLIKESK